MDNKIVGYIYIATNGSCVLENGEVKELVKIGYTDQHRLKDRIGEISKGSGVIANYDYLPYPLVMPAVFDN